MFRTSQIYVQVKSFAQPGVCHIHGPPRSPPLSVKDAIQSLQGRVQNSPSRRHGHVYGDMLCGKHFVVVALKDRNWKACQEDHPEEQTESNQAGNKDCCFQPKGL